MDKKSTVAEIATTHPAATRVFSRHKIDFCCGGESSLETVCEERGLDAASVLEEIAAEEAAWAGDPALESWAFRPVDELVQHVIEHYHVPLRPELSRLEQLAEKVARVHGERHPELAELLERYLELSRDLLPHLEKEEQVLFPNILAKNGRMLAMPIEVMRSEHETAGELLSDLRELASDFQPPADACASYRALFAGLEALERSLMEHIHLENHVLFPRALGS